MEEMFVSNQKASLRSDNGELSVLFCSYVHNDFIVGKNDVFKKISRELLSLRVEQAELIIIDCWRRTLRK